jgi:hypothetical protein
MIKAKCADGLPFIIVMVTFISLFVYSRLYVQLFVASRMYHGFISSYDKIIFSRPSFILYLQYTANIMMLSLFCLNIYWFTLLYKGVLSVYRKGMGKASTYGERTEISSAYKA